MTTLPTDAVRDIGLSAARSEVGNRVEDPDVDLRLGSADEVIYVLSFLFERDRANPNVADLRGRIAQAIRPRRSARAWQRTSSSRPPARA